MDLLSLNPKTNELTIDQDAFLKEIVKRYSATKNRLLKIDFTTVGEYLYLLKRITQIMSVMKENVFYYLAAAVSDFFLPREKMVFFLFTFYS